MKGWLKFFGLGFFSDDIARQAPKRGLGSVILAAFLGVVFLLLGVIAADTLTFKANYYNTPQLVQTVRRAFSSDGAALTVKDGSLSASRIINTAGSADDKKSFSRGYDIIVDTRKADTFDDFTAYCVSKSGNEITYEEYLALDADVKTLYTFKIRYSGKERVIDKTWVQKSESYLDGRTDEKTAKAYAEAKKQGGDEYAAAVYNLYVRTYYPSLTEYESDGNAPKTRNYYYHNYANREKTVFVFCDSMLGSFVTGTGAERVFYGYYGKLKNGAVGTSASAADDFVLTSFKGATAIAVYNAAIGYFTAVPFVILLAVAAIVLFYCGNRLLKLGALKFGAAAKTVCAFITYSALFAAIATFALGFAVSQSLLGWLSGLLFFLVLAVRCAVMLARDALRRKKAKLDAAACGNGAASALSEQNAENTAAEEANLSSADAQAAGEEKTAENADATEGGI